MSWAGGHNNRFLHKGHRMNDTAMRVHVRWMIKRDLPEVLAIEQASQEFPWSEEDFCRVLRQRNCIGMVAEQNERVYGFMVYELQKKRLVVLDFAVHCDFRHQGIGRLMVEKLVGKLAANQRTEIALHVRETNLGAQFFFGKMGFRATKIVRDHYSDTGEDAYVMQYLLSTQTPAL